MHQPLSSILYGCCSVQIPGAVDTNFLENQHHQDDGSTRMVIVFLLMLGQGSHKAKCSQAQVCYVIPDVPVRLNLW